MMRIGTAIGLLLCLASCDVREEELFKQKVLTAEKTRQEKTAEPVIKEYNFGQMSLGDSIEYVFELRNTGSTPVIIEDVKASCGCTTVDWMKGPISSGKTGWIKSRLKATDKGRLRKSVVAQLNTTDPFVVFYLAGEVTPSENNARK